MIIQFYSKMSSGQFWQKNVFSVPPTPSWIHCKPHWSHLGLLVPYAKMVLNLHGPSVSVSLQDNLRNIRYAPTNSLLLLICAINFCISFLPSLHSPKIAAPALYFDIAQIPNQNNTNTIGKFGSEKYSEYSMASPKATSATSVTLVYFPVLSYYPRSAPVYFRLVKLMWLPAPKEMS